MPTADATSLDRYYQDTEIACVAHQMLTGLDMVQGRIPEPQWYQASPDRKSLVTGMVAGVRRGFTADDLYRMSGGEPAEWQLVSRAERLRWNLVVLVVSAMAGEER